MRRDLILDTSLLVLLCVGLTSVELVSKHKRTRNSFEENDFEIVLSFVDDARNLVTTPYLLAEVSNHLDQHGEPERGKIFETLERLIGRSKETYHTGRQIVSTNGFRSLGVGDISIVRAARNRKLLTTDLDLSSWLTSRRVDAVNFNHLRDAAI